MAPQAFNLEERSLSAEAPGAVDETNAAAKALSRAKRAASRVSWEGPIARYCHCLNAAGKSSADAAGRSARPLRRLE
jgi:hypothetical protein